MKIGKLAKITGCSIQTIRYYEKEKLIEPLGRTESNFRVYDKSSIDRLKFIKNCRSIHLPLRDIRKLILFNFKQHINCDEISILIASRIDEVEHRIKELKELRGYLRSLDSSCSRNRPPTECGIIKKLAQQSS